MIEIKLYKSNNFKYFKLFFLLNTKALIICFKYIIYTLVHKINNLKYLKLLLLYNFISIISQRMTALFFHLTTPIIFSKIFFQKGNFLLASLKSPPRFPSSTNADD